jgi:hypothetical protein
MSLDDAKPEDWIYAGKRLSTKNTLLNAWWDPVLNKLSTWKKFDGMIGGIYTFQVERDATGITNYGQPAYTGRKNDDMIHEWRVADQQARVAHQKYRRSKAAKGVDPLDAAMDRLVPFARACRTRDEKTALIAEVIRRLTEVW